MLEIELKITTASIRIKAVEEPRGWGGQATRSRLWVRVVVGSFTVQVAGLPDGSGGQHGAHHTSEQR